MKRRFLGGLCFLLVLIPAAWLTMEEQARSEREITRSSNAIESWSGKCVDVSDGDTIVVFAKGRLVEVDLYAVDAPEKSQPFGKGSKAYTKMLVSGRPVKVFVQGHDPQRRPLGWVFQGSLCINRALAEDGYAWWNSQGAPEEEKLAAIQARARWAQRGLWADSQAVAPWQWRRMNSYARSSSGLTTLQ